MEPGSLKKQTKAEYAGGRGETGNRDGGWAEAFKLYMSCARTGGHLPALCQVTTISGPREAIRAERGNPTPSSKS